MPEMIVDSSYLPSAHGSSPFLARLSLFDGRDNECNRGSFPNLNTHRVEVCQNYTCTAQRQTDF